LLPARGQKASRTKRDHNVPVPIKIGPPAADAAERVQSSFRGPLGRFCRLRLKKRKLATMAVNANSPCPAGTGKKIKFCCGDLAAELEKIDRMIEGEQFIATLQHIDQLEAKGQHRACLMAIKSELLRATNQLDSARAYVADFAARFPENPVAWSETALFAAMDEGGKAAMDKLQRAIALCNGAIHHRVYEAIIVVAVDLIEAGHVVPGRALLHLLNAMNPNDRQVIERILYFNRSPNVPLLLKADPGMAPCPADVPWREKFEAAMEPMKRALWRETADRLTALAAEVSNSPVIWNNLARIRSWLADDVGAIEALRRYAALPVSLDDAAEAEATAMFLNPSPLGDEIDLLRWTWPVRDAERLQELLLSDGRVLPMPMDPASWPVSDSPPPRMTAALLDRPALRDGDAVSRDTIPRVETQVMLFGRETDRAARLEVVAVARTSADHVRSILGEIGGDTLEAAPEATVMGRVSASREMLERRWVPPPQAPREQITEFLKEEYRDAILNHWPDCPLGALDGRTLRQTAAEATAGDASARIKSLAAILVMEQWLDRGPESFDYNELRTALGLPTLGPIDPTTCEPERLPLTRLARLEVEKLDDEHLAMVFHRASIYRAWDAAQDFACAVVARPAFASRPERDEAYRVLIESATTLAEGLKTIDDARREVLAAGKSCAIWDLMELPLRFSQGDANEAMRLMQHIETRHINEPGVAQSLTRLLINAGLLNPDGTPVAMPMGPHGAEVAPPAPEPSKLWTPGGETAGSGGKLWTPGA
jgi:hypothetical protein